MRPPSERDATSPDAELEPQDSVELASPERSRPSGPDLAALSIAGITRRRVAWGLAAGVSVWIVLMFARQVADASAATDRANRLRVENAAISEQVAALQQEYSLVQGQAFIQQQARAYGLGTSRERPFRLAVDAQPLSADAPGSASVALGANASPDSPLEAWLGLLFGPTD